MRAVCKAPTVCAVFVPTGSLLAPLCFLQNFARLELKTSGSMKKACEEITRARVLHRACDRARRHAARQRRGVRSALVVTVPEPPRLRASCLATSDSVPEVPKPNSCQLVGKNSSHQSALGTMMMPLDSDSNGVLAQSSMRMLRWAPCPWWSEVALDVAPLVHRSLSWNGK